MDRWSVKQREGGRGGERHEAETVSAEQRALQKAKLKKGAVQIVLSSGSPFRPKGLAHRLHLLRPQGGWFLIRGPPLSSPGHWPCHLLSFTCPSSPPPSTVYATSPPKKQKKTLLPSPSSSPVTSLSPFTPQSWPLHPSSPLHHLLLSFPSFYLSCSSRSWLLPPFVWPPRPGISSTSFHVPPAVSPPAAGRVLISLPSSCKWALFDLLSQSRIPQPRPYNARGLVFLWNYHTMWEFCRQKQNHDKRHAIRTKIKLKEVAFKIVTAIFFYWNHPGYDCASIR